MLLVAQAHQQPQPQAEAALLRGLRALVSKVKLQGPLFFDPHQQQQLSVAALGEGLQQQQQYYGWKDPQQRIAAALHVNFTYAWLLTLCGGIVDALLWLLRTYPFLRVSIKPYRLSSSLLWSPVSNSSDPADCSDECCRLSGAPPSSVLVEAAC